MQPPDLKNATLDFSEFHPLDHWPGSSYCRELPGGVRNHLDLAWQYRWSRRLAEQTKCRFGRHDPMHGWKRDRPGEEMRESTSCFNCHREL
jgi:hypothetical protein